MGWPMISPDRPTDTDNSPEASTLNLNQWGEAYNEPWGDVPKWGELPDWQPLQAWSDVPELQPPVEGWGDTDTDQWGELPEGWIYPE